MIRKLNKNEIEILKSIYFEEIDYDKAVLSNQHVFSNLLKRYRGIVFDNTLVFTEKSFKKDFSDDTKSMALLIHEMCHVWQYQNLNYRWYKAGIEHIKFGKSTYSYNIEDHRKLTDFRFEQQGEIMSDFYKLKQKNDQELKAYEEIIYNVIKRG